MPPPGPISPIRSFGPEYASGFVIFLLKVLDGNFPDFATVSDRTQDGPALIVNFVAVKTQSPVFRQDFFPLELTVAMFRNETDDPPETSEIFHFTFTTDAADTAVGATPIERSTTDNLIRNLI